MTQLEALRLADMLENNYPLEPEAEEAAAELRRLHEENEQLRQALAQPEQEPVAWMKPSGLISPYKHGSYTIPLYTAPPKREWVGLAKDEIHEMIMGMRTKNMGVIMTEEIFREVEAKLKEKNGG